MEYASVEEKNNYFSLKNRDFTINIDDRGCILSWQLKNLGVTVVSSKSFIDNINLPLESTAVTSTSSSLIFEIELNNNTQLKKIYNIRDKTLVVDIYFISSKPVSIVYDFKIKFNTWIGYMMISKNKIDIKNPFSGKAKDFLLVNEKQNIYLGCIFKEEAQLKTFLSKNLFTINIKNGFQLLSNDMFMLSYTFALV